MAAVPVVTAFFLGIPLWIVPFAFLFCIGLVLWIVNQVLAYRDKKTAIDPSFGKARALEPTEQQPQPTGGVPNPKTAIRRLALVLIECRKDLTQSQLRDLAKRDWKVLVSHDKSKPNIKRAKDLKAEVRKAGLSESPVIKPNVAYVEPDDERIVAILETHPSNTFSRDEKTGLFSLLKTAYGWHLIDHALISDKFIHRPDKELEPDEIRFFLLPSEESKLPPPNRDLNTGVDLFADD